MTAQGWPAPDETLTDGTLADETLASVGDWLVAPELAPDTADPVMAPVYEAAARGALALPFCAVCSTALELEQYVCDVCGANADLGTGGREWRDVPLAGTVHTATLVHRREPGLIVATRPYPVIDVELASGHRLVLTTDAPSGQAPDIGTPVEIAFRAVGGVKLPAVRAARSPRPGRTLPTGDYCHDGYRPGRAQPR
jgi:uncharacterized OB-fold protein